jgi:hypothetical protein
MKYLRFAFALCAFLSTSSLFAQTFEWKLQKGQKYAIITNQSVVTKMNIPGAGAQEMPMSQNSEIEWKVTESDDKSFVVEQTIKRMKMSMKSAFINVEYDSDEEPSNDPVTKQIASSLEMLIGQPFASKMTRQGKVIEVTLPKELTEKQTTPNSPLSGSMLKQIHEQATIEFPESLSNGATWERSFDNVDMSGMKMKSKMTYRYDGPTEVDGKKLEKFSVQADVELTEAPPGMELTIEDQGNEGEILFDPQTGCVHSTAMRQKMTMKMKVAGQTIDQELASETTTTIKALTE